uniref:LAGLIDADG endonuclease n=1 Tax=Juglanconis oblonga TaxID=1940568 RepID=A0A291LI88_9PEZI|nr:LAGLIDADG endonuclease [Juglanconis oblonga]
MGYRGSKSNIKLFVKEQRVDGNSRLNKRLRCTLMGFERNYQIRILSKVLHKKEVKFYSTSNPQKQISINPWFLSGFIDGEGCFRISLTKVNRALGWRVQLFFQINLHVKDRALLEKIRDFLGVGNIHDSGKNLIQYRIQTSDELAVLINHLKNYPLVSQKKADYELFKKAYELVIKKEHLNSKGLLEIVALKSSLNLGLSEQLKKAFPEIIPAVRNINFSVSIPDSNWISGFVSAEGCFMVGINKSNLYTTGYQIYLIFTVTQHIRDELLMKCLNEYFGYGKLRRIRDVYEFQVFKFSDVEKSLAFFEKYPILGDKAKDFSDFSIVASLMKNKVHLTETGVAKIRKIKEGMNRGR